MPPAVEPRAPDASSGRARGRPRKRPEERDDGNRRRVLLAAAARLFRAQGFAATSTRDIAAAAGMQPGSPFYHFENKQALLAAVMHEGMRSALLRQTNALAQLPPAASGVHRLGALVRNHLEVLLGADSDFVPVMLYEWRALDAGQVAALNTQKLAYEAAWVPVLNRLHAEGRLAGQPTLARLMIFGALNWSVRWYQPPASGDHRPQELGTRAGLQALTDNALALFLKAPI